MRMKCYQALSAFKYFHRQMLKVYKNQQCENIKKPTLETKMS